MKNRNKKTRCKSADGFTMLETCVAMVVMFVAVLGAVSVFALSIHNNASANDRELSMAVGQQKLEQLRSVLFTDSTLNETPTAGVTTTITRAGRQYSVNTKIVDANKVNGVPTSKTITVVITPTGSPMGSVVLSTVRATTLVGPNRL